MIDIKREKTDIKSFRFNAIDVVISFVIIAMVIYVFYDYGSKLHFFPVILGLGGMENIVLGTRFYRNGHRLLGAVFLTASLSILFLAAVLAVNIFWGVGRRI